MQLERGIKGLLIAAAFVIIVAGLKLAAPLIVPFLLAAFIATLSYPIVRWLLDKGVPRPLGVIAALLVDLAFVAAIVAIVGDSVDSFYDHVPQYEERLAGITHDARHWLRGHGFHVPESPIAEMAPGGVMGLVAATVQSVASIVSDLAVILIVVMFILLEAARFRTKLGYVLHDPDATFGRVSNALKEVQKYLIVKTGISLAAGVFITGWALVWNLDFPVLWGLLAFVLHYIPNLGGIIAAIPTVVVAMIQHGVGTALGVLAGYMVITFILGNVVEPRVMGRTLGLSELVVLLSMIFFGWLWGPVGALLSVPLTMILKISLIHSRDLRWVAVLLGRTTDPKEIDPRLSLPPSKPPEKIVAQSERLAAVEESREKSSAT